MELPADFLSLGRGSVISFFFSCSLFSSKDFFFFLQFFVSNSALGLLYGHGILTIYENLLL